MTQAREASVDLLVKRYDELKRLYFSPLSDPAFDEEGQEVPGSYPSKAQIVEIFSNRLRVQIPRSPEDRTIRFIDGTEYPY